MKSISFPNMFTRTVTNLTTDYDATLLNLKLLLLSGKNSLFGDPYFGSNLRKFLFDQNDLILRDIVIDDIYTNIKSFMPLLTLSRNDITLTSDRAKVYITIKATNNLSFETNLYNIVLFNTTA